MANTFKTLADGDIVRKALSILHNELVFTKLIDKQYDDRFAKSGAKNGGTLLIREPNQFSIREGSVMDTQDVTEVTQTFTVAKQMGVDFNVTSVELTMSLDDFEERILNPAMSRLAAQVDAYGISVCYPYVSNFENTAFGTKPTLDDVLACKAILDQNLAPTSGRVAMVDTLAANAIITSGRSIFNPASEISRQYSQGLIGDVAGFKFYQSEMTPTHTNGSRTDSSPVVDLSSISNGDTSIYVTGAGSVTIKGGDVFTIAGVYAVNPETKKPYAHLKQWSVPDDFTCDSTGTLVLNEAIYKSGPRQNCYCSSWSVEAALVFVAAGGSGTASTSFRNSLCFHPEAFTMASADLVLPVSGKASRAKIDNISMRIWRDSDIINDKHPLRLDVLVGFKTVRPSWQLECAVNFLITMEDR